MARTQKNFAPRKDELVQIALDIFLEKGYERTKISDLQKAFGLTKGGMYHYFSSKEEILDEVIDKGISEIIDSFRRELPNVPEEDRLLYLLFSESTNDFTNRLFQYASSDTGSIVSYKMRDQRIKAPLPLMTEIIKQYVETGFYTCDYPEEAAEIILLVAVNISDHTVWPIGDEKKQKNRIDNMLLIWENCVHPPQSHLDRLREIITNYYAQMTLQKDARTETEE
ncbi:TetR/AcrR family transcriptional regulator [Enterococcus sp. 669A]|uniref:TetR/AcrR family transcriptional regulator n=1 Tax=Candidatus Enterococcus moelleringii TaxID=2815325 RepID=A0ABS3LB45_9ENTE|nr:TetR/AcrR family transcriptional regulator [Enterococcus sp. 669A]MBO1306854.1 TetR/AcrR family transcriptional regulator [Enterococcus sp. 669A]